MKNEKNILKVDNKTNKSFSYAKGNITLNFVLRTDIKQELKDFLECLQKAVVDVESEIKEK